MCSNEHPDMSGNPADQPFYCTLCGTEVKEEDSYGSKHDDSAILCSNECAVEFDENRERKYDL